LEHSLAGPEKAKHREWRYKLVGECMFHMLEVLGSNFNTKRKLNLQLLSGLAISFPGTHTRKITNIYLKKLKPKLSWALTPVSLATQEAEIRRIMA
jgi:hypothetical protein